MHPSEILEIDRYREEVLCGRIVEFPCNASPFLILETEELRGEMLQFDLSALEFGDVSRNAQDLSVFAENEACFEKERFAPDLQTVPDAGRRARREALLDS